MKKNFFTLILLIIISTSGTHKALATGIPVIDGANLGQSLIDYISQGLQLGEETVTAGAQVVDTINEEISTFNETVLYPMQDLATLMALGTNVKMIKELALGEAGIDPLLIAKPELYLKKQGQKVVRSVVEDPELQKVLKDTSILGNTLQRAKYDSLKLNSKLKQINTSSIPAKEQQARCTDEARFRQARKDVSDASGNFTQEALAARARVIYQELCAGDPNQGQTKINLLAATEKSASWDSWLALTEGDNDWAKNQRSQYEIQQQAIKKEEEKRKELENNGNIKSQTKCLKEVAEGVCEEGKEVIVKTADAVNNAFKGSLDAENRTRLASLGSKVGGLLGSVAMLTQTAFSAASAFDTFSNISDGFGDDSSDGAAFEGTGVTRKVISSTPVNDLVDNPTLKTSITNTPKEQLANHKKSLTDLIATDTKYLTTIEREASNLNNMKGCYENVVAQNPEAASDSRITLMQSYYNPKMNANRELYTEIISEKALAEKGITLINNIAEQINTSQSSEAIIDLFIDYQNQLKAEGVPDTTVGITRSGKLVPYNQEVDSSTREYGDIYKYVTACREMATQYGTGGGTTYPSGDGGI